MEAYLAVTHMLDDLSLKEVREMLANPPKALEHLKAEYHGPDDPKEPAPATLGTEAASENSVVEGGRQRSAARIWEHLNPKERSQLQSLVRQRGGTGLDLKSYLEACLTT